MSDKSRSEEDQEVKNGWVELQVGKALWISAPWARAGGAEALKRLWGEWGGVNMTCFLMQFPAFLYSFRMGFSGQVADDPRGVLCVAGCLGGILGHCVMNGF